MTKDIKKIHRLKKVLSTINAYAKDERHFNELYKILLNEYHLEGGDNAKYVMGSYNHNLKQTIDKQAKSYQYMKKRIPVKGASTEYKDFVNNFKQDVSEELGLHKFEDPS
jgi:hypothetical protein